MRTLIIEGFEELDPATARETDGGNPLALAIALAGAAGAGARWGISKLGPTVFGSAPMRPCPLLD